MKYSIVMLLPIVLTACMGAGTLGAVADRDLSCSEINSAQELKRLSTVDVFEPAVSDTAIVDWWRKGGYDFLDYQCMYIHKRLYMITVNSDSPETSEISIRSFYSRKMKAWWFAAEFSSSDAKKAEKAMDYLMEHFQGCQ